MKILIIGSALSVLLVAAGCDSGHGPDSLFNYKQLRPAPISNCTTCHNSLNSPTLDPLVTNGSGTRGKHVKHYQQRAIACERCHDGYSNAATHMNGTFETGNPLVSLVSMSITGPSGSWINDVGPGTGSCSGVACHGTDTLDWYGTNTWTTPACITCHTSAYSTALDPAVTNGTPPSGRHGKHVTSRNIDCERCHYQYPTRTSHANGKLDTVDPAVNLMQFNIVAPSGSWSNDTGPQTGQCATVSCHGPTTLDWYGASTWTVPGVCATCHSASFSNALDPLLTNGSGLSGKHVRHVTSFSFACSKCHLGYTGQPSHASGVMDTLDPSVMILAFDSTNPTGTWTSDTGAQTGTCSSLICHSGDTDWYTLAGVTLPACGVCHVSQIGARRPVMGANGDFGANPATLSHHVTNGPGSDPVTDQCLVCHDMEMHMGGTVRVKNADTSAAIVYSSTNPSTLEPFCLSCHDTTGALSTYRSGGTPTSPFIDGSTLGVAPYPYAMRVAGSWAKSYGHGSNGNHGAGSKLTCLGTGQPGTGCHGSGGAINAHGSAQQVLAARNFTYAIGSTYNEADYDLCYTCHATYPGFTKEDVLAVKYGGILDSDYGMLTGPSGTNGWNPPYYTDQYGVPKGLTTLFADHNESGSPLNNPGFWGTPNMNLHWFHLGMPVTWLRGTGTASNLVCVNCHDVHGASSPYGSNV